MRSEGSEFRRWRVGGQGGDILRLWRSWYREDMLLPPLTLRAASGLCASVGAMAALLVLSAGSVHFWAAWAFLTTFALCSALITADRLRNNPALVERRMRVGPVAEKERIQKFIQTVTGASFFCILIMAGLDFRFRCSCRCRRVWPSADGLEFRRLLSRAPREHLCGEHY
jgi:hypothetical protein